MNIKKNFYCQDVKSIFLFNIVLRSGNSWPIRISSLFSGKSISSTINNPPDFKFLNKINNEINNTYLHGLLITCNK